MTYKDVFNFISWLLLKLRLPRFLHLTDAFGLHVLEKLETFSHTRLYFKYSISISNLYHSHEDYIERSLHAIVWTHVFMSINISLIC